MNTDGEICAFIRSRKDKDFAIGVAVGMFSRKREYIEQLLRQAGLMNETGQYIEPVRLTGREPAMEKKKISSPSFRWSPERKSRLAELYQEGKAIEEIASEFGTDTDTVLQGIQKFNVVRSIQPYTASKEEIKAVLACNPRPSYVSDEVASPAAGKLKRLRHLTGYANSLQRDAVKMFLDDRCHEAFYALGKQELLLGEAMEIVSTLLKIQEP